jgi:protein FrlC
VLSLGSVTGTNFAYQRFPLDYWLDDMVALERTQLEIWGMSQHIDLFELRAQDVDALRAKLDDRGLSAACITPESLMYPVNFASDDPVIREYTFSMFRNAADLAADLGASHVFVTPGWGWENAAIADAVARAADGIHAFCAYAEKKGLRCVLEALQRHESNLAVDSRQLETVFNAVDAPNLGIALDTVAMATASEAIGDYFGRFGDRIWHVHLVDGSPSGHKAWGDGNLPLDDYLRDLRRFGYDGLMTAEIFGRPYIYEPTAAHRQNLTAIGAAFDRIDAAPRPEYAS